MAEKRKKETQTHHQSQNQTKQGENPNDTQFADISAMLVAAWFLVFLSTEAGKKGGGGETTTGFSLLSGQLRYAMLSYAILC